MQKDEECSGGNLTFVKTNFSGDSKELLFSLNT